MEFQRLARNLIVGFLASLSVLLSTVTLAATISAGSVIGLVGQYSSVGFPDVQSFDFVDLTAVGASGDFSPGSGADAALVSPTGVGGNLVDVASFASVDDVFSMSGASGTLQFNLDSITPVVFNSPDEFRFTGFGTVTGAGIDETSIFWDFSAESGSNYSLNITTVPVPAAVWLFGSALAGLGLLKRK